MLTLNDGRSELWQWDTGRTLAVDADCSQVHFSNKVFGRSIDVDVVDGTAIIPDILLQTDKDFNVWAFVGTAENGYTKISKTFKVNRRNKPADYVFTPTDQTTLDDILGRIEDLEKRPSGGNGGITKEVDPTVPDWAKQPQKPTYTAADVGAIPVPKTATVGQTIVVKEVDETGRPTEWEAVKLTEADKWEFINAVTIADDAEEASAFSFSLDKDGNPFSLRKALFLMYYPQYTGESTMPNFGFACINGITIGEEAPLIYTGIEIPASGYPRSSAWEVGLDYSDNLWKESLFGSDACYISGAEKNGFLWGYNSKGLASSNQLRFYTSEFKRTKTYPITSIGLKAGLIFPGCKFWIYGVKA